jgi:hypothetical protein
MLVWWLLPLPVLSLLGLLVRRRRHPLSMLLRCATWRPRWRRRQVQTTGPWRRCSRRRRRRKISLWRPLCVWCLIMIWRRHCSRSGRCSPPVGFLILRRLLLGQDRVGIRLRARSQGGVVWRAGRYGWILRVGARRRIELVVTCRHAEVGLASERGRRSLKVLSSLVGYAPIACRSLSRASAHVYPVLFAAPDCDVGLLRQLLWHFPVGTRAYVHHSLRWLDPSSLSRTQQQNSRPRWSQEKDTRNRICTVSRECSRREGGQGQDGASHVSMSSGCYGAKRRDGVRRYTAMRRHG